jgi:single-strand DNA-binding protein
MSNTNVITFRGRVGNEIKLRHTPSGDAVTDLRVANNRYWRNKQGDRVERTTWATVTVWGRQAELCGEYVKKGDLLTVTGQLEESVWNDAETGQRRSRLQIRAREVEFDPRNIPVSNSKEDTPDASPPSEDEIPAA